jgi:hypothetical protein
MSLSWHRIVSLARKDARELMRNPGAVIPAVLMVFASLFPLFLVIFIVPMTVGRTLEESGEFAEQAADAAARIPELAGLSGNALVEAFLFHQFSLLLLLVPIVSATALATHAVIGEKQSKSLEPLLATPISTIELLAAKTLTPFLFALTLSWTAVVLEVAGVAAIGEPGNWRSIVTLTSGLLNFRSASTKENSFRSRAASRNLGSTSCNASSVGACTTNCVATPPPPRRSPMLGSCVILTRAPLRPWTAICRSSAISCCVRPRSDLSRRNARTLPLFTDPCVPPPPLAGTCISVSSASGTRSATSLARSSM